METAITDMAITLTMFQNSQLRFNTDLLFEPTKDDYERDNQLRMHIENEYRKKLPNENAFYNNYNLHRSENEKIYRQEKLKSGKIPNSYKHRISFVHAHGFLSAADTFSKYLSVLSAETKLDHVKDLQEKFEARLPSLTKIRNSMQHTEDRIRGYGKPADVRKKIKMDLKPIDNGIIKAKGGVIGLSNLNDNRLGYTIVDGTYQELEISETTLGFVADIFQSLLKGFQWSGPTVISPHM